MLVELRVSQLGVIDDLTLVLDGGLTALTGETGAGKTLIVDAIQLLTGGPSDTSLVRPGASEALVEGRFTEAGGVGPDSTDEVILTRVVPARGRSRGYVNGRMVPLAELSATGQRLVDIHGQQAAQSLLSPAAQRDALDSAAGIDTSEVERARRRLRELRAESAALGGDARSRARELDLLTYQLNEIESAQLEDPDEDERLQKEEETLGDVAGLVEVAGAAWQALSGDDGLVERLGGLVAATAGRPALEDLHGRLAGLQEELSDSAAEARTLAETVEGDPDRLTWVGERRRVLTELRRKYGGSIAEVIAYRDELQASVAELLSHDERAAVVEAERALAEKELAAANERLWEARRAKAPELGQAIEAELQQLAMPRARFQIEVGPDPHKESVTWLLGANPGEPVQPLAKVASGGELARAMLAARLVVGRQHPARREAGEDRIASGPATLVFDEVDAGIGGEAATAVGRALAAIGADYQVLVVTHLAQVAAHARQQVTVVKEVEGDDAGDRTVARSQLLDQGARIVELARMLSGSPDSDSARRHAEELLAGGASNTDCRSPSSVRRGR